MRRVTVHIPKSDRTTFALVDDADYAIVREFRWRLHPKGYAVAGTGKRGQYVLMHRLLMAQPPGHVDHKNHNKLDNRRSNLRVTTRSQNMQNRRGASGKSIYSRHRGVSFDPRKKSKPWRARAAVNGREFSTSHATEEEAVQGARALRAQHMTHHQEAG